MFQSIINNTIVTPCLLGMDQLYSLIHTAVFFAAGSGSFLAVNANAAFAVDLAIMGAVATVIYSYLFQKRTQCSVRPAHRHGADLVLFQHPDDLTRVMDPNEYDTLLTDLVASFPTSIRRFWYCPLRFWRWSPLHSEKSLRCWTF